MAHLKFLFSLLLATMLSPAVADVSNYVASIKSDPNALYAFFKEMPKGGELHYHLDGGAYAETLLELASHDAYCLNPQTFVIQKTTTDCVGIPSDHISAQQALYAQTIRAWSMNDFVPGSESNHDHFHAIFSKIYGLESQIRPSLLASIMRRAASQHELYLEVYLAADKAPSNAWASLIQKDTTLIDKQRTLLANADFQKNITHTVDESKHILEQARQELHCGDADHEPACEVTVTFQYFALREQPLDNVFAQALTGFAAASRSSDVVGVNLVQVEDSFVALRDYRQHMRIFEFLHQAYPSVHIALHAGEINPKAVRPGELRFHIHDAIHTGHAERIGHGVDIAYEDHAETLLDTMRAKAIPVEINLTSNRVILNISDKQHPLPYYLAHHVPVVLSTDDEGILRTDLTRQYVEAVLNHHLDYPTIKLINRNALTYNFLPGKNLWEDPEKQIRVSTCDDLTSKSCQEFIKNNPKARLQWQLERKLITFEKRFVH